MVSRGFQTLKFTGVLALRAMFKISAEPRATLTHGDFHGAGESNHEVNTELIDFHLNMVCRDGIFNNNIACRDGFSLLGD